MTASTAHEFWFHRHPHLTLSAFALLGSIAVIILAELIARLVFPAWAPANQERVRFWKYDELLGWTHAPGHRGRFEHLDFSVEVSINSHGMRDSEYSPARTEKRRMLVLGDSFAWGYGVEHHERFSEILENAHPEWEIINSSVSGYGTDQQFLFLRERGLAFKPDTVLLLFYPNDFVNNAHAIQYWYFKPFFVMERGQLRLCNVPVPRATIRQRLERFFAGDTYLGARLYSGVHALLHLSRGRLSRRTASDQEDSDVQGSADVTYHLVTGMRDLCQKNGSSFVLVSTPMNMEKRAFLQRLAEREKIPYLPLDMHFNSAVPGATFPHDEHWNAKGHEIAAKAIEGFLLELGVFGAPQ